MNEEIVTRIRRLIEHFGLTITTFADGVGVQRSTISHVLSGRNKPSLDFVMKIVAAYPEVNLYWLLQGKGDFPSTDDITATPFQQTKGSELEANNKKARPIRTVIFYSDGTFESFDAKNFNVDD